MSILSRLAQLASSYIRRRSANAVANRARGGSSGSRPPGNMRSRPGPPPVIGSSGDGGRRPPLTGNAPVSDFGDDGEDYPIVELEDEDSGEEPNDGIPATMRQVASSNVYSYGFTLDSRTMGTLFVTFLDYTPKQFGGDGSRSGPGATYAYHDFPAAKFRAFEAMAASSAGGAVWDYCRVRHSKFEHQHTYQLIQVSGDYVPRKTTATGYRARVPASMARDRARIKQLAPQPATFRRQLPKRNYSASPNRGEPNRGTPNRGN